MSVHSKPVESKERSVYCVFLERRGRRVSEGSLVPCFEECIREKYTGGGGCREIHDSIIHQEPKIIR